MDTAHAFTALAIALGLGLLVGLQRERADSALAGFRTFPLITMLGCVCAMLADSFGGWILGAGLLSIAAATGVGNLLRRPADLSPGITTEVAALLMFVVGALLWVMPLQVGTVIGVGCAVLLHMKESMHTFAGRFDEKDMRGIMLFCAITFVVLPVLPDRTFGPLNVLNPRNIWWMVVLVVGISLAGYVALKLVGGRVGAVIGGLIGGLISSTATTVSFSRRAAERPEALASALLAIILASCVVYARVLLEVGVVAQEHLLVIAPPILTMGASGVGVSIVVWLRTRRSAGELPKPENPTQLKSALLFAALYALVLLAVGFADRLVGAAGIYVVAGLSGLTDMDAITLSTGRMASRGLIPPETAWRAIVTATMCNLLFKFGICAVLGGRAMLAPAAAALGTSFLTGALVLCLWPA